VKGENIVFADHCSNVTKPDPPLSGFHLTDERGFIGAEDVAIGVMTGAAEAEGALNG
jgi:hypothetical protein